MKCKVPAVNWKSWALKIKVPNPMIQNQSRQYNLRGYFRSINQIFVYRLYIDVGNGYCGWFILVTTLRCWRHTYLGRLCHQHKVTNIGVTQL